MFVKVWCQCVQAGKMEAHFHVVCLWKKGASLIFLGKSHWGYHRKWLHMVLVDGWESTFLLDLSIASVDTLAMKSLEGVTWHHPSILCVFQTGNHDILNCCSVIRCWLPCRELTYGGFLKWWYPQIIHFNRVFHYNYCINHPFWGTPVFGNTHISYQGTFEDDFLVPRLVGYVNRGSLNKSWVYQDPILSTQLPSAPVQAGYLDITR